MRLNAPDSASEQYQPHRSSNFTEEQAAEFLHLKKKTLQAWRVRGAGPPFLKLGKAVRYRISDLETFVMESMRTSTSDQGPNNSMRKNTTNKMNRQ